MTSAILALLLLLAQAVAPQPGSQSGEDTGQIRGRVTDKETGRPLPDAQVMLMERTRNLNRTATTDDAGVFRFTGLPPGKYGGSSPRARTARPTTSSDCRTLVRRTSIELAKGAVREINIALSRTRAIPVRVVDEFGDPLSDVYLSAYRAPAMDDGRDLVQPAGPTIAAACASAGLRPGRYVVCADSLGTGGTPTSRIRCASGCCARVIRRRANEADAEPIAVGTGPIDEIEIRMRRGRTFTISGIVLDARACRRRARRSDCPCSAEAAAAVFGFSRRTGWALSPRPTSASRRLRHPGLDRRAGSAGGRARARSRVHPDSRGRQRCRRPRRHVEQRRGRAGPHRARGPDATAAAVARFWVQVMARLAGDFLSGMGSGIYAYPRTDRTFTLTGVFGRRTLDFLNVPVGWYVKHVRYRGDDVIDKPIDFARGDGTASLEVVLSNRGAMVTGRVIDDLARPVRGAFVWLLRADGDTVTEPAAERAHPRTANSGWARCARVSTWRWRSPAASGRSNATTASAPQSSPRSASACGSPNSTSARSSFASSRRSQGDGDRGSGIGDRDGGSLVTLDVRRSSGITPKFNELLKAFPNRSPPHPIPVLHPRFPILPA